MLSLTTLDWAIQIPNDSPKHEKRHNPYYASMTGAIAL